MPDLIGVIISKDTRLVLLRTNSTSEVMRAVQGQNVGGWEARDIKPTQVVLQRGDESEVIRSTMLCLQPRTGQPLPESVSHHSTKYSGSEQSLDREQSLHFS